MESTPGRVALPALRLAVAAPMRAAGPGRDGAVTVGSRVGRAASPRGPRFSLGRLCPGPRPL